jgi:Tfp pilus assembly protein FimV
MNYATLLIAVIMALPLPASAQGAGSPVPASYVTKRGDSILSIAKNIRHPKATLNQMAYALIKANGAAFSQRTVERLLPNTTMTIPDEATVLSTDAETADREMARLGKGEELYKTAVQMEKQGDMHGALAAYLSAAQLGHGLADVRLGELYERDVTKTVPRDLETSIRHYEEARKQGIPLKGPLDRVPNMAGPKI